jgi:pimeloyl-ACP methyl ester carboxylesterase
MAKIQIAGRTLSYDLNPDPLRKETITAIFIHGSGGDRLDWKYQLNGLAKEMNTISIDLPGHGESEGPQAESIQEAASTLTGFIEALDQKLAMVVGCSLGSAIALQMALDKSPNLVGVGLVGSGAKLKVLPAMLEATLNEPAKAGSMVADFALSPNADQSLKQELSSKMSHLSPGLLHKDLSACNDFDVMKRLELEPVEIPVWICVGEDDKLTPVKYSEYLHEAIGNSTLRIIPGAGHLVMLEKPDQFNRGFLEFVKQSEFK